jgi:peptidyl-prolyl cis-trans isomerase C
MAQHLSDRPDERAVRTPDGRVFASDSAGKKRALGAIAGAAFAVFRKTFGGLWKFIATVWRLAEALDSALWRGLKLGLHASGRFFGLTFRASAAAFAEVFRWLPSRSGRAYAAGSSVVLFLCALWAADEIRNARADSAGFDSLFRPPIDLNDPIVARVDGRYIHVSEVEAFARASGQILDGEKLSAAAAFERELVGAYVEQRLLARAAVEEGLQRDPSVQRRLNAARDRILASSFMEDRIAAAVTPERVKRLYDSQADVTRLGDEVKARHILVASEKEARAIIAELGAGGDFAAYARARSLDRSTAPLGGEIGWFTKDMMTPPFAAAAFSTPVGSVAEPFASEFGWHILEVLDRRPTGGVAFAAVEDNVKRFLTMRAITQTIDALKDDEDVAYFPPDADQR